MQKSSAKKAGQAKKPYLSPKEIQQWLNFDLKKTTTDKK
jgi:hypothetical protein